MTKIKEKIKQYMGNLELTRLEKIIIAGIMILIIILIIPFFLNKVSEMKENYYKQEIINNSAIIQYRDKTTDVPIKTITKNKAKSIKRGIVSTNNIEYKVNGIKIGFNNFAYGPHPYVKSYSANVRYVINKTQININIGPNMDPYDDVIEGFMFFDFLDNGTVLVHIYVDEDWKKRIRPTTIIWGKMNLWSNYTHSKKFNFHKVADGIYRDIIVDDPNRWLDNYTRSYGGIKVGKRDIYLGM